MPRRARKLLGAIAILVFVPFYGLVAMALAESRIQEAPHLWRVVAYVTLGLAWILPVMPVIRWMERPDET
jgi:hypothetical protein